MNFLIYLIALCLTYLVLTLAIFSTVSAYKNNELSTTGVSIQLTILLMIELLLTAFIFYIIGTGDCNNPSLTYPFK